MFWSFTGSKTFANCQRQWFYRNYVVAARAKEPIQREAYLLSRLQTVYAWRGQVVDGIISRKVIPALAKKRCPSVAQVLAEAQSVFQTQRDFALAHGMRNPNFTKPGDDFAAFVALEYGEPVSADDLAHAWQDIENALTKFLSLDSLLQRLMQARRLVTQRTLYFNIFAAQAVATPDLIAFYDDTPPLIADWKVHTYGTNDYRQQLATYALALERSKKHKDFPAQHWRATDMQLLEVQLLSDTAPLREYQLVEEDVEELEDKIVARYEQMSLLVDRQKRSTSQARAFSLARDPETCLRCPFRRLCQKEIRCEEAKQMNLL